MIRSGEIPLIRDTGYADFLRAVQRPGDIWSLVSAIETLLGTQTGRAAIIAGLAEFGVTATNAQLVVAGSLASVIRYVQMLVDLLSASWNGQTDGTTTFWLAPFCQDRVRHPSDRNR